MRRISELLGKYIGGGGLERIIVELETGVHARKPLSSFSNSKSNTSRSVESKILVIEDETMKKDCDWLNHKTSYNLTANEKPGMGKRKREVANEREGKHTLISYLEMH